MNNKCKTLHSELSIMCLLALTYSNTFVGFRMRYLALVSIEPPSRSSICKSKSCVSTASDEYNTTH